MENEIKKEKVTLVKPQDLTLDNARTEYCKVLDLFLSESTAAGKLLAINEDLKAQIEKITSPSTGGS